ncbi:MAG: MFS transporter [Planctomycetota bacterium]
MNEPDGSSGLLIARLSVMMFLQYWPLGLWGVTFATFLAANTGDSGEGLFDASFIGKSQTAGAVGSLLAPLVVGWFADRFGATERVLAVSHFAAAAAVWSIHEAPTQWALYVGLLVYYQLFGPTVALTNSIALAGLKDPDREFPVVRVFGTVAWISSGVFIGVVCRWWWGESIEATRIPMALSAVSHLVMAAYSLTLPRGKAAARESPPLQTAAAGGVDPHARARLWRNTAFLFFLGISVFAAAPSIPYNLMNLFLNERGYQGAAATLTMGQVTEVLCFIAMPALLTRFGLKAVFLVGVLGWALRYALLVLGSYGGPDSAAAAAAVYVAIIIHGPCYAFVYVVGQMYVDRLVPPSSRTAAQGMHTVATNGIGHLFGAGMVGWTQAAFLTPEGVTPAPYRWPEFWLVPIVIGVVTAAVFAATFTDRSTALDDSEAGRVATPRETPTGDAADA